MMVCSLRIFLLLEVQLLKLQSFQLPLIRLQRPLLAARFSHHMSLDSTLVTVRV
jgi:hypothetical protein